MLRWGADLTWDSTLCVEKALLGAFSPDPFEIYYRYFKRYGLTHGQANVLGNEARANSEKTARRVLYNSHDDRPPAFFDSANTGVSAAAGRSKTNFEPRVLPI